MKECGVSSEYMLAVAQLYEKVICCVRKGDEISGFSNTIVVKQGCLLSPTTISSRHS